MKWVGIGLAALAAAAIVLIVAVVLLAGGSRVTVISMNNNAPEALDKLKDIFPVEEGVYCSLDDCCAGEGGVSAIDIATGAVVCASGEHSATCRCPLQDVIRR